MAAVVNTNLLGVMLGAKVAYNGMRAQGGGAIYNVYGFGSTGSMRAGQTIYGSTKYAIAYFTRSMLKEIPSGSPVLLCSLSPGIVTTDLLESAFEDPAEFERARRIFNILADRVEAVTPWMAEQILANRRQGADIRWLTRARLLWRFATAPFVKRDLFGEPPPG
jgi:NAD(P)-dependent dehydrogenase (short-subunit alcohol dehydrogenase family)